ncbi:MAG: ParB/RepB/Spo0J family partition protein [Erysipelotrichaceae bacterium]|jgi:ParB family chromosome partitioning protein|nr:ParB/RepB/Spo0J family partition protein [Erysipelotrichaceae bacterium]
MKSKIIKNNLGNILEQFKTKNVVFDIIDSGESGSIKYVDSAKIMDSRRLKKVKMDERMIAKYLDDFKNNLVKQPIYCLIHDDNLEVLIGRKRLAAAQRLKAKIGVITLRFKSDYEAVLFQIADIIDRKTQNVMEVATLFDILKKEYQYTQRDISLLTALSRSQVANILRLLSLPQAIQDEISENNLSFGHAKVLVNHDEVDLKSLVARIKSDKISVHDLERIIYEKP